MRKSLFALLFLGFAANTNRNLPFSSGHLPREQIEISLDGSFEVRLIDVSGRTVVNATEMYANGSMSVAHLASGMYFALVTRDKTTIARKIQL